MSRLQKLLCPDLNQNESTLLVKLENFLKLVKCFGPFGETNGQCYTLTQFEKFLTQSARKIGTSKISWFAGDISREQAEVYLEGQRKGTYLLRLSQSEFGAFALSVVAVEGEPPLHVMFKFEKDSGDSAEYIWFNRKHYSALKVIEYCQRELFDDDYRDLRCRYECPNLPFNSIVTGYRGRNK
ncbi:protein vav-like [Liolophura sinensis]|uniref:protein vav-like n=1 Tax=Liolophura sinensis TaxID=3198878 RepID=UPI003158099A